MGCLLRTKKSKLPVTLKNRNKKYRLTLIEKVSGDTRRFRFALPSSVHILGVPVGQHVQLSATINNEEVVRSYTPTSSDNDKGYVDFVIKIYFKNDNIINHQGGKMSQYLESLQIGDTIDIQGPVGRLQYTQNGTFMVQKVKSDPPVPVIVDRINLIAGGTGITPMIQVIRAICCNPTDNTELRLIYANHTENDILLRNELNDLAKAHGDQFRIWFTISKDIPDEWKYGTGRINEDIIKSFLFPAHDNTFTLMCGPPAMINQTCVPCLKQLGHSDRLRFIC